LTKNSLRRKKKWNDSRLLVPSFQAGAFVGGGHDAAAGAGDDHQVVARQGFAELAGEGVDGVVGWRAGRAEDGDFAATLELLQGAEGVLHFAQGLQHDLGVPAVAVGLGHAGDSGEHLAVQRQVLAVAGGGQFGQFLDLLGQVGAAGLEVSGEVVVGLIGHVDTPCSSTPDRLSMGGAGHARWLWAITQWRFAARTGFSRRPAQSARGV